MMTGLFLIMIILITGTFAFQQFNQGAFNPAWDDQDDPIIGGRVHDDFEIGEGPGPYNKDVYAENFGEVDIFVRIQLREFLAIDTEAIAGALINDPSTWPIYLAEEDDVTQRRAGTPTYDIGEQGITWTFGGQKYFMPTHNHVTHPVIPANIDASVPSPFNDPEAYRFTNTTGRGVDALADEFISSAPASAIDILADGIQTGPDTDGTHNFWGPNDSYTSNRIYINAAGQMTVQPNVTHEARPTLSPDNNGFMTIAQWNDAGQPDGNFWIMDVDGWFYWNGYLPAGEATSLLLDAIYIEDRPEAWEYIIHINADFFTRDSIDNLPGLTPEAEEIFRRPTAPIIPEDVINTPHALWTDSTGRVWRVLEPANIEGVGGYGNALLISEHLVQPSPHPLIIDNSATWFNNHGAPELHQIGMSTTVAPVIGGSNFVAGQNTLLIPDVSTIGAPLAYPLSQAEVVHYFAAVCTQQPPGNGACSARATSPSPVVNNAVWHTRSLRFTTTDNPYPFTVGTNGSIAWNQDAFNNPNDSFGYIRPALWVNQEQ